MWGVEINTWLLLLIAFVNGGTAVLAWRTKNSVDATQKNVEIIEKATNSLTDRLVASTDAAARAETRVTVAAEDRAEKDAKIVGESKS